LIKGDDKEKLRKIRMTMKRKKMKVRRMRVIQV